jgi:hypothetical protein
MPHVKYASKRKRTKEALPVLGIVGISLSLAGGTSAGTGGPATDIPSRNIAPSHEITLHEEEVFDVSLGTFFVFDREGAGTPRPTEKFAHGPSRSFGPGIGGGSPGGTGCGSRGGTGCRCGGCTGTGCGCSGSGGGGGGGGGCGGGGGGGCGSCGGGGCGGGGCGGGGCCLTWGACRIC